MRRIQGKNIKWEHKKSPKYHYVFNDERFILNDGVHTLAYFHQNLKK